MLRLGRTEEGGRITTLQITTFFNFPHQGLSGEGVLRNFEASF